MCTTGWHLPDEDEWAILETYLGGNSISGGKMKEAGTRHWISPNTEATNETGFTGIPVGSRIWDGTFRGNGNYSNFWSSVQEGTSGAWYRYLYYMDGKLNSNYDNMKHGHSVRCIKD